MVLPKLWKCYNLILNCFVCYEQSDWSKKGILRIYHIIRYSWHRNTRMWPVMFLQDLLRLNVRVKGSIWYRCVFTGDLSQFWLSCLDPWNLLHPITLKIIWNSNLSILSVPDEGYSTNRSCALILTFTFVFNQIAESDKKNVLSYLL